LTKTLHRISGGTQRSVGAFVQDIITPVDKLVITLAARVDSWRNYDAHNLETTIATNTPAPGNVPNLPERDDTVVSPRAAALYHLTDRVSVWGGYSSGFRAPTLNELYRQFRVGPLLTIANADLRPERLRGGELGTNVAITKQASFRAVWFDNRVKNPVQNVTIGTNLQQRQNLGRTQIQGFQTDAEYRIGTMWRISGAYLVNDARVTEFSAVPALVNNCRSIAGEECFLPQVPRNRGSFHVSFTDPRYVNLSFGVQFVGLQYDDDANSRGVPEKGCPTGANSCIGIGTPGLPGYATMDFTASRQIGRNLDVFFGVQNLADRDYYVQTNPSTIGSPRLINGGVRVRFSGK
jgi:outer membrane receptor protein involved in Fe transport